MYIIHFFGDICVNAEYEKGKEMFPTSVGFIIPWMDDQPIW